MPHPVPHLAAVETEAGRGLVHAWLRAAQGLHWFGHKASPSQRYWVMAERCRRPRRVKGGRIAGKGEWKLPARNCTVPFCV